jgi:hypothetical protein
VVGRQQQVIAVVDLHVERGIVVRAAAPARLPGRFVQDDRCARLGEPNGGRQPGETRADDVNRAPHQITV